MERKSSLGSSSSSGRSRPAPLTIEKATSSKKWWRKKSEGKKGPEPPPNTPSIGGEERDPTTSSSPPSPKASSSTKSKKQNPKDNLPGSSPSRSEYDSSTISEEENTSTERESYYSPAAQVNQTEDMFEKWRRRRVTSGFDSSPSSPTVSDLSPRLNAVFEVTSRPFQRLFAEKEAASSQVPSLTWKVSLPPEPAPSVLGKSSSLSLSPEGIESPSTPRLFRSPTSPSSSSPVLSPGSPPELPEYSRSVSNILPLKRNPEPSPGLSFEPPPLETPPEPPFETIPIALPYYGTPQFPQEPSSQSVPPSPSEPPTETPEPPSQSPSEPRSALPSRPSYHSLSEALPDPLSEPHAQSSSEIPSHPSPDLSPSRPAIHSASEPLSKTLSEPLSKPRPKPLSRSLSQTSAQTSVPSGSPLSLKSLESSMQTKTVDLTKEKKTQRFRLRKTVKKVPLIGSLKWTDVILGTKEFLQSPSYAGLALWCLLVTLAISSLSALEIGFLDSFVEVTDKQRKFATEICIQTLIGLFVLMCVIWHPKFVSHSFQLWRWSPKDIQVLRTCYSRGGTRKPNEWIHMAIVIFWLHTACFSVFAFALVYWFYEPGTRPLWAVISTTGLAWGALAIAFLHTTFSPLGGKYKELEDYEQGGGGGFGGGGGEGLRSMKGKGLGIETASSFSLWQKPVAEVEWQGTIVPGCCNDPKIAVFTCLFPFWVFGLNMERLEFGHRWVHATAFISIVFGPFLIFLLCTNSVIQDIPLRHVFLVAGVSVSVLSVLYGSCWRTHMRRTYRLPSSRWGCGSATVTDVAAWLFCPLCALCQEVRTAEHYRVEEGVFYEKGGEEKNTGEEAVVEVEVEVELDEVEDEEGEWRKEVEEKRKGGGRGGSGPMDAPRGEDMV